MNGNDTGKTIAKAVLGLLIALIITGALIGFVVEKLFVD